MERIDQQQEGWQERLRRFLDSQVWNEENEENRGMGSGYFASLHDSSDLDWFEGFFRRYFVKMKIRGKKCRCICFEGNCYFVFGNDIRLLHRIDIRDRKDSWKMEVAFIMEQDHIYEDD